MNGQTERYVKFILNHPQLENLCGSHLEWIRTTNFDYIDPGDPKLHAIIARLRTLYVRARTDTEIRDEPTPHPYHHIDLTTDRIKERQLGRAKTHAALLANNRDDSDDLGAKPE